MRISTPSAEAVAFAPGHVTGVFAPSLGARDPRARGSVGAGIVLSLGATAHARFSASVRPLVRLSSDIGGRLPISREVCVRLLGDRDAELSVRLQHSLPVGQGFGMSAAGALAAAMASAAVLRIPETRAVEIAHLAELFGGGGLGGVPAILKGGLEHRESPGIPPFGRIRHHHFPYSVLVSVTGLPLPSLGLLRDSEFRERVERAAHETLPEVLKDQSADRFLSASERFTDSLRLTGGPLGRTIHRLRETGARVAQAMFGRSLFAVPRTPKERRALIAMLGRMGLSTIEMKASERGARVRRLRPGAAKRF